MSDYQGSTWFWHRFIWKLPSALFTAIEQYAVMCIAFFHSPKKSLNILRNKRYLAKIRKKANLPKEQWASVGSCFTPQETKELAKSMRNLYCSCLWKKGDILLIDNKKVMHAGMPGKGERLIRALICNRLDINCSYEQPGLFQENDMRRC